MSKKVNKNVVEGKEKKSKFGESLSAMMDNEATEFEFRRILKECATDDELKEKWERYHFVSSSIRGETRKTGDVESSSSSALPRTNLLARINQGLAEEGIPEFVAAADSADSKQTQEATSSKLIVSSFKRLGQGIIAASVAAVVLYTGNNFNTNQSQLEIAAQIETAVPNFNGNYSPTEFNRIPQLNTNVMVSVSTTKEMDEAARDRLRRAVYQEFEGQPLDSIELPVNFSVTSDR